MVRGKRTALTSRRRSLARESLPPCESHERRSNAVLHEALVSPGAPRSRTRGTTKAQMGPISAFSPYGPNLLRGVEEMKRFAGRGTAPPFLSHISVSLYGKSWPPPTGFYTFYIVHTNDYPCWESSLSVSTVLAPPTRATCGMLSRMRRVPTTKHARVVHAM